MMSIAFRKRMILAGLRPSERFSDRSSRLRASVARKISRTARGQLKSTEGALGCRWTAFQRTGFNCDDPIDLQHVAGDGCARSTGSHLKILTVFGTAAA